MNIEQEKYIQIAKNTAKLTVPLLAIAGLTAGAFSRNVRETIRARAQYSSELSGRKDRPMQCSHWIHDRNNKYYNHPLMGILLTDEEHFVYHNMFRGNARLIGLTEDGNSWAINSLVHQVQKINAMHNYEPMEYDREVEVANILHEICVDRFARIKQPAPTQLLMDRIEAYGTIGERVGIYDTNEAYAEP